MTGSIFVILYYFFCALLKVKPSFFVHAFLLLISFPPIAGSSGGAVSTYSPHNWTLCYFEKNFAAFGGALSSYSTIGRVTSSTFLNNSASSGGAVFAVNSSLLFVSSVLESNAANLGGAFCILSTPLPSSFYPFLSLSKPRKLYF
jgi:predicted outer membrane repeat protein